MKNWSPFIKMLLGAVAGVLLGIGFGLIFGLLISWIAFNIGPKADVGIYTGGSFLGMGAGAIIGSILGAVYANRK